MSAAPHVTSNGRNLCSSIRDESRGDSCSNLRAGAPFRGASETYKVLPAQLSSSGGVPQRRTYASKSAIIHIANTDATVPMRNNADAAM